MALDSQLDRFICGADHPTVAVMKIAAASGTERDINLTMPARRLIPAIILLGAGAALAQQTWTPVCREPNLSERLTA
jgi:hypothetical protein